MLNRRVLIVSQSPETLDGVQEYLARFGALSTVVSRLQDAEPALAGSDALLLFADDYPRAEVTSTLSIAAQKLCVVVTEDVDSMESARRARSALGALVLLRRPVWGWTLLDALRTDKGEDHV